jgi:predicted metalloprotease with PDZ domain
MKRNIALASICLLPYLAAAQKLSYDISFPNATHHEAKIELEVSDFSQKELVARMSRSSPGRYATHEYGKNVYDVKAFDKSGNAIEVTRLDGDVYKVSSLKGYVKISYTLYANHPDGTYAGIDETSILLNGPATYLWIKELEKVPIHVRFSIPEGKKWQIATQLKPASGTAQFSAPDLQYLMDSPVKIGDLQLKDWTLKNTDDKSYHFELALEAEGSDELVTQFADKVKRVTEETLPIFGELPDFDYGKYIFIASVNPYVKGDGMEHRNSTVINRSAKFDGADNLLGVYAHEFFHAWNVERLRPKSLEPFNYEKSNMSHELWFAEGFTQYYGELILKRAGFVKLPGFVKTISELINTKENTAGAKRVSPAQASNHAVFVDAGIAVDKNNYINTYSSYYTYGAAVALALDLELRARQLSLDDYMKALWQQYGKSEKPYVIADLEEVLGEVSKDQAFARTFFDKYVNGIESFSYAPLLEKAGFKLEKAFPNQAWWGDTPLENTDAGLKILMNTRINTPLYQAGLDVEDLIISVEGKRVRNKTDLDTLLSSYKPGDQISLEYMHRGETKPAMLTLQENPKWIVKTYEELDIPVNDHIMKFRAAWLNSKIK